MALLLMEGFDHLTVGQVTLKGWSSIPNGGTFTGRFAGQALGVRNSGGGSMSKSLPSTYTTLIMGTAIQAPSGTGSDSTITGLGLRPLTSGGSVVAALEVNGSGKLVVLNNGGTTIATGTTTLVDHVWYYVELKIFVNGASGSCEVQLNGVSEIAPTTGNFGSTAMGQINLASFQDSKYFLYDDIYVVDTSGADNNTFLGDVRVQTVWPSGAGSHTQWQANGAGSNYQCVDETTPNDDTDYVSDANPGDIDTYAITDIDGGAAVYGVQTNLYARKDDANTRQIAQVIRQSGTDYVGTTKTLSSSYLFYSQLYDKDPTSTAWTASNVNADEFGVKEIA